MHCLALISIFLYVIFMLLQVSRQNYQLRHSKTSFLRVQLKIPLRENSLVHYRCVSNGVKRHSLGFQAAQPAVRGGGRWSFPRGPGPFLVSKRRNSFFMHYWVHSGISFLLALVFHHCPPLADSDSHQTRLLISMHIAWQPQLFGCHYGVIFVYPNVM